MDKQTQMIAMRLLATLQAMVGLQEELGQLIERKREAMRTADPRLMGDLVGLENQKVQAISELEKGRLELVAKLTLALRPAAKQPMTMAELAQALPEPLRTQVVMARQQLREKLAAVKEQTTVARRAADHLARHVQGLVQAIAEASTSVKTYARPGRVMTRPAVGLSTFSMTA